MNLNNMRLAAKLWLAVGLIVLGLALVVGYTASRSASDRVESTAILEALNQKIKLASQWAGLTETNAARSQAVLLSSDPAVEIGLKDAIANTSAQIGGIQKSIEAGELTSTDRGQLQTIANNRKLVLETRALAMKQRADGLPTEVTTTINTHYQPAMLAYQKSQRDFVALQEQAYEKTRTHYAQRAKELIAMSSILMALLVAAILGGAAWLIRSIRQPLLGANELAARIAQGDLSMQIDTSRGDEFGDLMRSLAAMNESLGRMVNQVRQSTDSIATASAEIATGNNDLAQRTEQTSSNLQSTASSMDQLTTNVQQSADNARQASVLAANASSVAEKGGAVVQQVVSTMEEINVSSKKIADIIGVIDGIAFQTNILALNAAVEAARAGEAGAGFAVVANEVRSLAMRAAEAAKNTAALIEGTVQKVKEGSALVGRTNTDFAEVAGHTAKACTLASEIVAASQEQSQGISQISQAVVEIDKVIQGNAAGAEESSAASEELNHLAKEMQGVVMELAAIVGGSASEAGKAGQTAVNRSPQAAVRAIPSVSQEKGKKALAAIPREGVELSPKQIIPMTDEDFKDF